MARAPPRCCSRNVAIPGDALIGGEGAGLPLVDAVIDEATVAVCGEACGVLRRLHEGTLDYTKQRKQFGQPIGQFQVLQHRMVDMFIELEQSISMTYMATIKLSQSDPAARAKAVSAAKAQIGPRLSGSSGRTRSSCTAAWA